jgi:hypothetical protein
MDREVTRIAKAWTEFAASTAEPGKEIFITRIEGEALRKASTSTQCYVHHRRMPDLGDDGVCGFFYKL